MSNKRATPAMNYPHIAARVFDTPLLIEPSKLDAILHVLGPRLGFDVRAPEEGAVQIEYADPARHLETLNKARKVEKKDEGYMVADGVAIVPVIGTMVQRSDWMTDMSGMISYDRIESRIMAALEDPSVRELILEIDSPGGEVAGAFDLADRIANARGNKPIIAVATETAASAAYLLASTADEIVVPRTGYVGSIGVVTTHVDYSRALEKRGIAVTLLYAGDKKVDGNPYEPLTESARGDLQSEINQVYELFVNTVSENRDMGVDRVRGTQAGLFMGFKAVDVGLADRVNSFSNELSNALLRRQGMGPAFVMRSKPERKETLNMLNAQQQEEARLKAEAEAKARAETEAKLRAEKEAQERAEAEAKAKADAEAKARADAVAHASTGGKERIKAILTCEESKGRGEMAQHLAFETDLSVDQAKAILKTSPKGSKLESVMDRLSPNIASQDAAGAEVVVTQKRYATTSEVYRFLDEQMRKPPARVS